MSLDVFEFQESVLLDDVLCTSILCDVKDGLPSKGLSSLLFLLQEYVHVIGVARVLGREGCNSSIVNFHSIRTPEFLHSLEPECEQR